MATRSLLTNWESVREEILELRSSIEEEIVYTCDQGFQLNKSSRNQKQSPKGSRKTCVLGIFEW